MAMKINPDDCTSCGSCEAECPTSSISAGPAAYVINAATCTECDGAPKCVDACPMEAISKA